MGRSVSRPRMRSRRARTRRGGSPPSGGWWSPVRGFIRGSGWKGRGASGRPSRRVPCRSASSPDGGLCARCAMTRSSRARGRRTGICSTATCCRCSARPRSGTSRRTWWPRGTSRWPARRAPAPARTGCSSAFSRRRASRPARCWSSTLAVSAAGRRSGARSARWWAPSPSPPSPGECPPNIVWRCRWRSGCR